MYTLRHVPFKPHYTCNTGYAMQQSHYAPITEEQMILNSYDAFETSLLCDNMTYTAK